MTPPVTWLMPVLNAMPFLRAALRSIADQDYPKQQILVWENGSTDGSQAELRRWIPDRIPGEIIFDRPLPPGQCRAALVERAATELCACQDADDVSAPTRLSVQTREMMADPALVALGFRPYIVDHHDGRLPDWCYPLGDAELRWRTKWKCSFNASAVMFRRSAVIGAGNYHDFDRAQDLDLWMRLAHSGRFKNLPDRLGSYRRHAAEVTSGTLDYYPFEARIADVNATMLFPKMGRDEALDLWHAAYPRREYGRTRWKHLPKLFFAARAAARAIGERDAYFTDTMFFRHQIGCMVRNATDLQIRRRKFDLRGPIG